MELMLLLLSLLGVIAYVALNYATKEPSHPQRDKLLAIYGFILIIMLIVSLFIQWPIEFSWQGATEFYAIYGFAACIFLIYVAKVLRVVLPRDEDYYEKKEEGLND
jgi:amino acid transporter